ncbi:alpha/beta hydrolase [Haladaptatus pallidirubidus]|uniref:Alpha/beta hydrolase n=2 Tax=Haladaptatus pallidirubidus TaxID=1008152 RepID=A0AAV3UEV1_9EURY|nr:alpha/beta hydrolase [Haladaptatus pallidirubidus]
MASENPEPEITAKRADQLDPDAKSFLETLESEGVPQVETLSVEQARALHTDAFTPEAEPESVASVEDSTIGEFGKNIPVRIYTPEGDGPRPALVYFHGGGWVLGNLDTHDSVARSLANRGDCVVVSVEYRKAPENPFPAAVEDAYEATKWTATHAEEIGANPDKLAVGGESAGGNLAAIVAQMARDKELGAPEIDFQLLAYPVTNHDYGTKSYSQNGSGYFLSRPLMIWFWNHYLREDVDGSNVRASPLLGRDLSGLPPAFVLTAGYDPLRDEGAAYASRLSDAGVSIEHANYNGMIHDFLNMRQLDDPFPDVERADDALDRAGEALREAFEE